MDDEALRDIWEHLSAALRTGPERTIAQDPEYGLRQLVDVVIRALPPGINDPTTAVHGLHSCTMALSEPLGYHLGPHVMTGEQGDVRVVITRAGFAELLALVCAQPRLYGADDPAVRYALLMLLHDLAWKATLPDHRTAIAEQLTHLRRLAPPDVGTVESQRTEILYREVLSVLNRQRDE